MSNELQTPQARAERPAAFPGDSLLASAFLLVGLTVVQRLVGFGRNIVFCHWLEDDQLGRWSLAFNFLLLAAPLLVLGLPGSFGRYVEYYQRRGQLRPFLRSTVSLSVIASLAGTALLVAFPQWFARFLFDDASQQGLVRLLGIVLLAVVGFNLLVELLTALTLVRYASLMQLVSSCVFALAGIGLLVATPYGERAVLLAYGLAACMGSGIGLVLLVRVSRQLPAGGQPLANQSLWSKLAPFAFWVWAGNLITNLFEVSDQFMLKHFSGLPPVAADSLIGQYYSSRVIPLLMISAACMFASSLVPHLTREWDAGQFDAVRRRMQLVLKGGAVVLTLASAAVLVAAPWLFANVLGGKYDRGLQVLPATLTYCVWYCLGCLATSYLLCSERAKWSSVALSLGLATNLLLNYCWASRFGLPGVVGATAVANAVALASMLLLSRSPLFNWDRGVWLACLLPLSLLLEGWAALAITGLVALVTVRHPWIFSTAEATCLQRDLTLQLARIRALTAWPLGGDQVK